LHVFGPGVSDLTVEIPTQKVREAADWLRPEATTANADNDAVCSEADDYVLGGYAGI
jgi:hypothetical protein